MSPEGNPFKNRVVAPGTGISKPQEEGVDLTSQSLALQAREGEKAATLERAIVDLLRTNKVLDPAARVRLVEAGLKALSSQKNTFGLG